MRTLTLPCLIAMIECSCGPCAAGAGPAASTTDAAGRASWHRFVADLSQIQCGRPWGVAGRRAWPGRRVAQRQSSATAHAEEFPAGACVGQAKAGWWRWSPHPTGRTRHVAEHPGDAARRRRLCPCLKGWRSRRQSVHLACASARTDPCVGERRAARRCWRCSRSSTSPARGRTGRCCRRRSDASRPASHRAWWWRCSTASGARWSTAWR